MLHPLSLQIKAKALDLGFSLVGLAPARPAPHLEAYLKWVGAGMHGQMSYLGRADRLARRRDLNLILPGAKTLIVVGVDYAPHPPPRRDTAAPGGEAQIATYAGGKDYHAALLRRLEELAGWIRQRCGSQTKCRAYVDTGAILEKDHAQQAGLGFIGKNTLLINPRRGSDFFLGEILTDLEVDAYDPPHRETMCGTCRRCLDACPTQAFPQPYVLDARRCISYLTIEHPGWIDRELRPQMGSWVFGCDVCRDVCPWQKFAPPAAWPQFQGSARRAPDLGWLLAMDEAAFERAFRETAIHRLGRERLVRNACVAAGNSRNPAHLPALKARLDEPGPLVRGHAAWALARLAGRAAAPWLQVRLGAEGEAEVRRELEAGLREAVNLD